MIKGLIKIFLTIIFILIILIIYLSFFGIKTDKFNNQIKKSALEINSKINLKLSDVTYLLNPYNFSINISTKNPQILVDNSKIKINTIKTNISLKSLINDQFLIDDLQITTADVKIIDLILLTRTIHNTPQLFILNTIVKEGNIEADININFDDQGKVKSDYLIKGLVNNTRLNLLNKSSVRDLNFSFQISKNKYTLNEINADFNKIKLNSPFIQIEDKKDLYFIQGSLLTQVQQLKDKDLTIILGDFFNNLNVDKIKLSSKNNFSFTVNKKLKFNNIKVETNIDLDQLTLIEERINLKPYIPKIKKEIKFENQKIKIKYSKDKLSINGNGNIFLTDKVEQLSYEFIKNNNQSLFSVKLNIKNNPLIIDFLDYKKKEGINSTISINGNLKKNGQTNFELITLEEGKNKILINNLQLGPTFKIVDIGSVNTDYKNNKDFFNKVNLKKNNSNFILVGDSLDLAKFINDIMNNDDDSSVFKNLNARIDIKIKKTYIDEVNYLNNLSGYINFKDNKINNLKLDSIFPNNKKINLIIHTNEAMEIVTRLSTDYPKPLIKRYNFIKGFEGGYLNFNSIKKDNVSNSVLIIDNFKVQKVPIFAKLLSLASLQGIADVLTGEGIRFTELEMKFSNQKNLTKIEEMYAIGPAVSILMDGYIEKNKLVSLRGTLVPATTINRTIASIPILGDLLIGDKIGEGVFGVSFKVKGPPKDLSTTVNPIKTLTPRFITRTLEKIKKN